MLIVSLDVHMEYEAIDGVAGGVELLFDNEAVRPANGRVLCFYGALCWVKICRPWRMREWLGVGKSSGVTTLVVLSPRDPTSRLNTVVSKSNMRRNKFMETCQSI